MDRNTIIGLLLIVGMLLGYQFLMPEEKPQPQKPQQMGVPKKNVSTAATLDTAALGSFSAAAKGTSQEVVLENKDVRVTFSTQGGRIKEVLLKNYKTYDQKPLYLFDEKGSRLGLELPNGPGKVDVSQLFFTTTDQSQVIAESGSGTVAFTLQLASGQTIEQRYTLPGKGFTLGYDLNAKNFGGNARLFWSHTIDRTEKDVNKLRNESTINYLTTDESFDHLSQNSSGTEEQTLEEPIKWLSFKQMYFVSGLVGEGTNLSGVKLKSTAFPDNNEENLKTLEAEVQLPAADLAAGKGKFKLYFGPNDYQLTTQVAPDFNENVYLGYAFLKPVNRYVFVPLFNLLGGFISNYGVLIFVLVFIIKLILTPLTYKSYISMAKMRVLQPELAALKEKIGDDDAQKMQQEQMKLYQQVGVNPLSGCVPQLLTLPILMSVFFLFPNLIELRQQPFLWTNDLSAYDDLIKFGFSLPILGNHISLFTVMMTGSSILFAYYNNQTTVSTPGPVDYRTLGYIMPLVFFFIMNSFPAGLAWYYLVSNLITIGQQQLIKRFVDEDKIKAILEENRRKISSGEKKKSKFSEMLEKQLKAAEEAKKQAEAQANKKKK
ncbi:membrane protein insertase YidC [Siphonobacter sp. BAB-5405]|uniref:membrane protein insertase YidC n=1 Tax=Siphonobacter sp. BAB-5405 TaxID=1864825 RepID=UPI000C7F9CCE|nr:membrane protein insertase YidC [Siphonobacter sp. BAB-5405]PMD97289.1 membrane protein insertase YidC [Siphonobacter sp. BAB-5405]